MRIFSKKEINLFINKHSDSKESLNEWYLKSKSKTWTNFQDIKNTFNSVDYVKNDLYVFNINGNKYRVIARIFFQKPMMYIRFIGTHAEYDKLDLSKL
jgi:mRNA interferase HigB